MNTCKHVLLCNTLERKRTVINLFLYKIQKYRISVLYFSALKNKLKTKIPCFLVADSTQLFRTSMAWKIHIEWKNRVFFIVLHLFHCSENLYCMKHFSYKELRICSGWSCSHSNSYINFQTMTKHTVQNLSSMTPTEIAIKKQNNKN